MPLHIASPEEVRAGKSTDIYFDRTQQILRARERNPRVRAEFVAKSLPGDWEWAVLGGIEEVAGVLEGCEVNVRAMPEGTVFRPLQPVLEIEGTYLEFGVLETAVLGLLCQSSGIATRAARCRIAAGDRTVLSFGARRMHPSVTPMIERAAYIGGCDGVSAVDGAELIGQPATGTMPHALILIMGDTVEATKAFDEVIDRNVPRISLIDTFQDEKFEAIRVAEALGDRLNGVRLDTPGTRRGNFYELFREVRWELDLRGYQHVRLYASGGINEASIAELAPVVDGFGVGSAISAAPIVDFSMDIVEIAGQPLAKRGKWSGAKQVWRCSECHQDALLLLGTDGGSCSCGGTRAELLEALLTQGHLAAELRAPTAIREAVLEQLRWVEPPER